MSISLRVVLTLLGVSLLALTVTGEMIYSRLAFLWLLLLGGSWVWAKMALRGVHFQRKGYSRRARVGQIFREKFNIRNTSRFPIFWLEMSNHAPLPGQRSSRVLTWIGGGEGRSFILRNRLVQRGLYPLGPTELIAGDLFGLFHASTTISVAESLLVYPVMVEIYAFPNPAGFLPDGEALRHKTPQVTPNAASVREYVPGDTYNRIHWASTARRNRLMVKEFELDPLADVWIFVDAAHNAQASLPFDASLENEITFLPPAARTTLPPLTEEYAVSIAASLGRYYLNRGRAVGLIYNSKSIEVLPPDRSNRQLAKMLEILAVLRADGDIPFPAMVSAQARQLLLGSTVVLITPSVQQEISWCVDYLLRLNMRPVVVLLDAESFGGSAGTEYLSLSIRAMGVPVYLVENGADLTTVLNMAEQQE